MSDSNGNDPLETLRRANPVDRDRLPSASLDRVRMRVQEVTTMGDVPTPRRSPPRFALAGLGAALVVALVVVAAPRSVPPLASPVPTGPPAIGLCVEFYDLETLRHRTMAFDGTVQSVGDGGVTLIVNEAFRGVDTGTVTVTTPGVGPSSISIADGPAFEVGGRYLLSGDERFAWGCGFTQTYDPDLAAAWRDALTG